MDQLHPWGSTGTGLKRPLHLYELFGTGTQIHHIQLEVINVWLDTVIPSKPDNIFFNQKVFAKQGKDKKRHCNDLLRNLEKGPFQPQLVVVWYVCQLQS